jgi:hypothetical protein
VWYAVACQPTISYIRYHPCAFTTKTRRHQAPNSMCCADVACQPAIRYIRRKRSVRIRCPSPQPPRPLGTAAPAPPSAHRTCRAASRTACHATCHAGPLPARTALQPTIRYTRRKRSGHIRCHRTALQPAIRYIRYNIRCHRCHRPARPNPSQALARPGFAWPGTTAGRSADYLRCSIEA